MTQPQPAGSSAFAGAQVAPTIPPGWKLVPDTLSVPPEAPPDIPTLSMTADKVEPAAAEKLSECEQQVAAMNEKLSTLQNTTEMTRKAMRSLKLEQLQLKAENELLLKRAEESDRQFMESMDTLSEIIDEFVPPATEVPEARPARSASLNNGVPEKTAILLPTVE